MNSNNVFDKINETVNSDELADDAYYSAQSSNAVEEWFSESFYSPKNFRNNNVINAVTNNLSTKYIYNAQKVYEPTDTLMICSASIKTCPFVFEDVEIEELINSEIDSDRELKSLLIYGHNEDYDDDFNSRLDDKLIDMISRNFKHKYNRVCLFGCFENIDGLKNIISQVYERMTDKGLFTKIAIYLDSKVKDDEGKWRTIADLINSGYVRPNILGDNRNIVEYIMKKFDKKNTARLFTKSLKINTLKNLFETYDSKSAIPDEIDDFFDETSDLDF